LWVQQFPGTIKLTVAMGDDDGKVRSQNKREIENGIEG